MRLHVLLQEAAPSSLFRRADGLMSSLPGFSCRRNVMLMCLFLFIIFGILGINVFKGRLRYRCFEGGPGSENITLVDPNNSTAVDDGNFTVVDDEQVKSCREVLRALRAKVTVALVIIII